MEIVKMSVIIETYIVESLMLEERRSVLFVLGKGSWISINGSIWKLIKSVVGTKSKSYDLEVDPVCVT
ncbi:MAG: hypothetical protein ACXACT_17860 [Candidatus Thorarchaeota archaeon]